MKRTFLFLLFMASITSFAQQALFGGQDIKSPEIKSDNSVVFRLFAPNADTVRITGDFLPTEKMKTQWGEFDAPGKALLKKDEKGVWSFTSSVLKPELYSYSFIIDGFTTTDPNNPFIVRDVASVTNIFIIGGGHADLYKVNDVPHGTVAKRWYDSPGLGMDRRITVYTPAGYEKAVKNTLFCICFTVLAAMKKPGQHSEELPRFWIT
jgi:hypothetical protein